MLMYSGIIFLQGKNESTNYSFWMAVIYFLKQV